MLYDQHNKFNTLLLFLGLIAVFLVHVVKSEKPTRNVLITAEEEKLRDIEGFEAIKSIHAILDDDNSGSIDRAESADFLTEDLKFGGSDRARRENVFHHNNDNSITVDDLWENWFQSGERGWDNKQIVEWLTNQVKLPQYANNFVSAKVTGMDLPKMAAQNSSYLAATLAVKNYVHRQKLQLKALDLVLFGFQDSTSLAKDIVLAGLLGLLITVLIIFKKHKNRSKHQMEELSTVLNKLRDMETDFEGVQDRLNKEIRERPPSPAGSGNILTTANPFEGFPFGLQPLLRRTYEIEWGYLYQQKLECLHEMNEAKEIVDKMRRKQTSFVNSLKLATGATSGTDDIDNKIFSLKARMEKIKMLLNECTQRWTEIENNCGFSITDSYGAIPTNGSDIHANAPQAETRKLTTFVHDEHRNGSYSNIAEWNGGGHQALTGQIPVVGVDQRKDSQPPGDASSTFTGTASGSGGRPKFSLQLNSSSQPDDISISSSNQSNQNKKKLSNFFRRKISKT